MEATESYHIKARSGRAFQLQEGQHLRIIDTEGGQVADVVAFAADDKREWLSSGRSFDYNGTLYLTTGHVLYSNRSRKMLTIVADDAGRHDFLYAPCSREMFELQYGRTGREPNCLDNLTTALEPFGIAADAIPIPFNAFMNVEIDAATGTLTVKPPQSRSGDAIEFRAEMDLIVGVSACSADTANGGTFGPIDVEVIGP